MKNKKKKGDRKKNRNAARVILSRWRRRGGSEINSGER